MEEVTVTIKKDGSIVVNCNGFQGDACDITRVAEEALGMVSSEDKDERYMNVLNENQFDTN